MPTKTQVGPTLQEKFAALRKAMRSRLVEREEEIEIFMLALLSRSHAFFGGEPGIAKSYMVEVGVSLIEGLDPDNDYYYNLFMKQTSREDVFGPLDLPGLDQGRYNFLTRGYFPECKIAFGDEFWKANAAILNALLLATNERKFRNDGRMHDIPLHTLFIASNEMPESDELRAIYDRMLFRRWVKRIAEPGNRVTMLKMGLGPKTSAAPVLTWDDVLAAHVEVTQVTVPQEVLDALNEVAEKLFAEEIYPSDRRIERSLLAVQAAAWLDGETEADIEHLACCRHIFWDQPDDYPVVEKILLELANPLDKKLIEIMDNVEKVSATMEKAIADNLDEEMKARAGAQVYAKLKQAKVELRKIEKEIQGSKKRSAKFDQALQQQVRATTRMLMKLFDMNEEDIDVSILGPSDGDDDE